MSMTIDLPAVSSDWRGSAIAGTAIIVAIFGIIGGWSAIAEIDQAVHAPGAVSTEFGRKIVQHYEGGIVDAVLVKEGDSVKEGQPLLRLKAVQAQANVDLIDKQRDYFRALEARGLAETASEDHITWPADFAKRTEKDFKGLLADQEQQFKEKRQTLLIQMNISRSQIDQLKTQISGATTELDSTNVQIEFIKRELTSLKELADKNLVQLSRVYAMERERSRLDGVVGRIISEKARSQEQIGEAEIQIKQMQQKYTADAAAQLSDARQKIAEINQRIDVANDILTRIVVVSPTSGTVQGLKVFSGDQVIRSGESLMEIVPNDEPLIIAAEISPNDIDGVSSGKEVEIHFPSFHDRKIPMMLGTLRSVSHDRLINETTRQPYYNAVVALDRSQIPEEYRSRLRPGMPADVTVSLGQRTVLSYLISPMTESLRHTFTER